MRHGIALVGEIGAPREATNLASALCAYDACRVMLERVETGRETLDLAMTHLEPAERHRLSSIVSMVLSDERHRP